MRNDSTHVVRGRRWTPPEPARVEAVVPQILEELPKLVARADLGADEREQARILTRCVERLRDARHDGPNASEAEEFTQSEPVARLGPGTEPQMLAPFGRELDQLHPGGLERVKRAVDERRIVLGEHSAAIP